MYFKNTLKFVDILSTLQDSSIIEILLLIFAKSFSKSSLKITPFILTYNLGILAIITMY